MAPDCLATVRLNKRRLSCRQVSEEKRGGQFCHGTLEVRVGCTKCENIFKGLVNAVFKGGNHSSYLPTLCAITSLQPDLFSGIGGQSMCCTLGVN